MAHLLFVNSVESASSVVGSLIIACLLSVGTSLNKASSFILNVISGRLNAVELVNLRGRDGLKRLQLKI